MSPEKELIASLCETPLSESGAEKARLLLARRLEWDAFFAGAAQWELEPLIMTNLRAFGSANIPAEVLKRAAEIETDSRARTLSQVLLTVDLVQKLEEKGVRAIVLKGPAIGVSAYVDPSLRPFSDIDLLVERADLLHARDILLSMDFVRQYEASSEAWLIRDMHALEFIGRPMRAELHWALLERHLRLHVDPEEILSDARTVVCTGREIRVLAPHHLFLFLLAHGAKHEWERVRWICDLAQLADRLEKTEAAAIVKIAERMRARRLLALGLHLIANVLERHPSAFDGFAILPESDTRDLVSAVRRRLGLDVASAELSQTNGAEGDPRLRQLQFWIRTRERLVDRIASLAEVVFVPTERDKRLGPLAWVGRPIRLAVRTIQRIPK